MRIKIFLKKLISISVAVILAVTLVACFDLGDFSDEDAYYKSFGDIRLVYATDEKEVEHEEYSVSTYFYNENTGASFEYDDEKTSAVESMEKLQYLYMSIPIKRDMNIESLALYFNGDKNVSVQVLVYLLSEENLPDGGDFNNIRLLGDPEYPQEPNEGEEPVTYSDPDDQFKVATTSVTTKKDQWVSFMAQWNGESALTVENGQYLVLRFINNGGLNTTPETAVAFNTTNLLVRAFF